MENSPSLCPTMFSVTYTGMNFLPLCTATVCPTNSGVMVERRDQVRRTFFSLREFMASIRCCRKPSTNGPFLVERINKSCPWSLVVCLWPTTKDRTTYDCLYLLPRRLTMNASVRLLLRVLYP